MADTVVIAGSYWNERRTRRQGMISKNALSALFGNKIKTVEIKKTPFSDDDALESHYHDYNNNTFAAK